MTLTKKERFSQIMTGHKADRPIVSGWHHFLEHEHTATDLVNVTIAFAKQYDWDWIKINPRATYLAEAFGNQYDYTNYEWVFPSQLKAVIEHSSDLKQVTAVHVDESAPFQEQFEVVKQLRRQLNDTPLVQTLFSPLTVLMFLAGLMPYSDKTMPGSQATIDFNAWLVNHRSDIHFALYNIAVTLADYVQRLEHLGVDGLFYATTGTAHPELFTVEQFNEFSRPYDMMVLQAFKKKGRILHTCGAHGDPVRFNDYPVEGISWDPDATGNPELSVQLDKVKVAGVSHHIFESSTDDSLIKKQAKLALAEMKNQPFLLVPNCAVSPNASASALKALRESIDYV